MNITLKTRLGLVVNIFKLEPVRLHRAELPDMRETPVNTLTRLA